MKRKAMALAVSACAAMALSMGVVRAESAKPEKSAKPLNDMKVSRDKDTGQLRIPTDEENAALTAKGASFGPNVVVVKRPVTTVEVRADGSAVAKRSLDSLDNVILSRDADGKAVLRHQDRQAPTGATQTLPKE